MSERLSCWDVGITCWGWMADWDWAALGTWAAVVAALATSIGGNLRARSLQRQREKRLVLQACLILKGEIRDIAGVGERLSIAEDRGVRGLRKSIAKTIEILECPGTKTCLGLGADYPVDFILRVGAVLEVASELQQQLLSVQLMLGSPLESCIRFDTIETKANNLLLKVDELRTSEYFKAIGVPARKRSISNWVLSSV